MGKGSCKRLRSINASVTRGPYPAQAGSYLIIFYKGLNVLSNLGLDPTTPRRRAPGAVPHAPAAVAARAARGRTHARAIQRMRRTPACHARLRTVAGSFSQRVEA